MNGIVVDTSALVAIYRDEQPAHACGRVLNHAKFVLIPATCFVEAALLRSAGGEFFPWFSDLVRTRGFRSAEITDSIMFEAIGAASRYGKGAGHPAQLNFGDCFSYAVAKHRDLPLLYIGDDFGQTDIVSALAPG